MFILTNSENTPKPKYYITEALPNTECANPDICILNETNYYNAILLNSKMLKEALLANKDVTKNLLGLIVTDINEVPITPVKKPAVKKPAVSKIKPVGEDND